MHNLEDRMPSPDSAIQRAKNFCRASRDVVFDSKSMFKQPTACASPSVYTILLECDAVLQVSESVSSLAFLICANQLQKLDHTDPSQLLQDAGQS